MGEQGGCAELLKAPAIGISRVELVTHRGGARASELPTNRDEGKDFLRLPASHRKGGLVLPVIT